MIIILTGAPGAGKGTQTDLLVERNKGFTKISTGDALRNQVRLGSKVGLEADKYMKEGKLVPDDVILGILSEELKLCKGTLVLLDGYPRNVKQVNSLETLADRFPVLGCIYLNVARDVLIARLSGRRVCKSCGASYHIDFSPSKSENSCDKCGQALFQRSDDEESKVGTRLEIFENDTRPVLDFYHKKGVLRLVDGQGSTEEVYNRVLSEVHVLQSGL